MKTNIYPKIVLFVIFTIIMITACTSQGDKFDYNKEVILITGAEHNPLVKFVVEDTPASFIVTASATGKVSEDIKVTFALDNSLVDAYNYRYKTNYYPVPEQAIEISGTEAIIKAGSITSTGINVRVISTEHFIDGRIYVIPITIKSVSGGDVEILGASRTIFLRISRVIDFASLDISNPYFYGNYYADAPVDLPRYTFEIKCYINEWHPGSEPISRLCNFCPIDESITNLLRFGEHGLDINALQWVSPGGAIVSSTRFATGRWYTISLTFDGKVYTMYVDGVKDAELAGNKGTVFQRLELGMSWYDSGTPATSYPYKQRFLGRIAEIRLWNRALTPGELQLGICGVDPSADGLVAYWKLNEGEGYIFRDATGKGYDIDWSKAWQNDRQYDKSSYVKWVFDDKNKCSQ